MTMEKYLVTIEFRYSDAPRHDDDYTSRSKMVTLAVTDNFNDACIVGNDALETLEGRFQLHTFPDGRKAAKERFSKNGGPFGSKKDLITNLAYLKTPFEFYAKITKLSFDDLSDTINEAIKARERYKKYRDKADAE